MPDLPKAFQTFLDPFLFQIFIDRNEGDWKMPFEWHDSLEIFYTLKGKGRYFIDGKIYTFEKGDLFVIGNQELHKSQLIEGEPFEALIIMFNPKIVHMLKADDEVDLLSIFYDRSPGFSHKMKADTFSKTLIWIFKQLQTEFENNREDSLRSIISLLNYLLIFLKRKYGENEQLSTLDCNYSFKLNDIVSKALEYVDEHFHENINLPDIANSLNVSSSYLSREFKRVTGFTLIEFITTKKVRHAKNLLGNSFLQVTEIASEVGYNNVTHFNWIFKKKVGMSPGKYRKYTRKID
ncbi:hypothetical protein HMPREF3291_00865 [Bacillus sp. HMSC76G11]|nr:hypothetical protein HMPREF3291_00865 [Bacillus sp. HMSC76G11]